MSMKLMASVMELDLPGNEKIVLMTLARFAGDDGGDCHPSITLLAARAGISSRSAQRMIRNLEKRALIDVAGRGRGTTYRYYLRPQAEAWIALTISHSEARGHLQEAESSSHADRNIAQDVPDNLSATGAGKVEKVPDNLSKVPDNLSKVPDNLSKSSGHRVTQSSQEAVRSGSEAVNAHARDPGLDKPGAEAKRARPKAKPKPKFMLPDWVPLDAWNGWLEMRQRKKAPATERAKVLAVKQLEKLWAEGHEPGAALDQSTMRGWTGIFPLKGDQRNGNADRPGGQPQYRRNPGFEMLRDAIREERELRRLGELPSDPDAQADYFVAGHPLSLPS